MNKIEKSSNSQNFSLNLGKETISMLTDDSDQGGVRGVDRSNRKGGDCWYSRRHKGAAGSCQITDVNRN